MHRFVLKVWEKEHRISHVDECGKHSSKAPAGPHLCPCSFSRPLHWGLWGVQKPQQWLVQPFILTRHLFIFCVFTVCHAPG